MSLPYEKKLISNAKALRKKATPQENHLWYDFLSKYPIRFQRQKTIENYIVDFYCHKAKIAVEIDGSQHYENNAVIADKCRTAELEKMGLTVLRYSNRDINLNFKAVCEDIDNKVKERILK